MTTTAQEHSARLAELLLREHLALADFLVALSEFDEARGWVELGFASLFDYLHRSLGLSKGAAFYRMTAARLVREHPAVLEPLRDGRLCLTSVVALSKALTAGKLDDVLPRFFGLSTREAKAVTAELVPEVAVPRRVVVTAVSISAAALAVPGDGSATTCPTRNSADLDQLVGQANQLPALPPAAHRPPAPVLIEEPKTAELSRIHVTVPRRFMKKIEEARAALWHSHPRATEDEILELGLDLIIERHAKRRGIGTKPRLRAPRAETTAVATSAAATSAAAVAPPRPKRSRHVPAHVWRAVWERDGGRCVWPVAEGGVCGSTHKLQLDHIDGWALGVDTTVERCRLLCASHNDLHARGLYGDEVMDRCTRPKRGPRCWEPVAAYAPAKRRNGVPPPRHRSQGPGTGLSAEAEPHRCGRTRAQPETSVALRPETSVTLRRR